MKKLVLAVIVTLFSTSFATQSQASGSEDNSKTVTVLPANQGKSTHYTLVYTSKNEGKVRIDIFDPMGNHLKYDIVENSFGFKRSYNFSSLPKGKYYIRVKDQDNLYRTTINHLQVDNDLKVKVSSLENAGKYNLEVIHNSTNPVWVNIFDSEKKIIYSDKIDVDHNFSRVYDLGRLHNKAKSIEVYSDGKSVKHALN